MRLPQVFPGVVLVMLQLFNPAQAAPYLAGGSEWRPFSYEDENGNLRGISTDIARRVLQQADIDAQFISYPVNRLQAMLARNELDISFADSPQWNSPQELSRYVFSTPYMSVREHLYFLKDNPALATPVDKLNGLTIGIVRGYTYRTLDPLFEDHHVSKLETSETLALLKLLQARRVDAVALVDDLFDYLVSEQHLDPAQFVRGAQLSEAPVSFKLQPQHAALLPRINEAIHNLIRSHEVERIRQSYLNRRATNTNSAGVDEQSEAAIVPGRPPPA